MASIIKRLKENLQQFVAPNTQYKAGSNVAPKQNWVERNIVDRVSANTPMDRYKREQQFNTSQQKLRNSAEAAIPLVYNMNTVNSAKSHINSQLNNRQSTFNNLNTQKGINVVREMFDANSAQDRMNRMMRGEAELYRQQQRDKGRQGRDGIVDHVVGSGVRFANTVKAGAGGAYGLGLITKDAVTGGNVDNRINSVYNTLQKDLSPNAGLYGRGTMFMDANEAKNISAKNLAIKAAGYGAEIGSLGVGAAPLKAVAAGTKAISAAGLKSMTPEIAKLSASGALGAAGFEAADDQNVTLKSAATAAVMGAVGAPVVGVGAGLIGNKLVQQAQPVTKKTKEAKYLYDKLDPRVRELDAQYAELNKLWQKASPQGRKQYEQAILANRKLRSDITRLQIGGSTRRVDGPSLPPKTPSNTPLVPRKDGLLSTSPSTLDSGRNRVSASEGSIDPIRALNNIKDYNDVLNGNKPVAVIARISPELSVRIKQDTGINVKPNAPTELSRNGAVHIEKGHGKLSKDINPLDDQAIGAMPYVIENPDVVKRGKTVRGAPRIRMEKRIDQNRVAIVEVIKKGDSTEVVTYFNDSPSGRPDVANAPQDIRSERNQSTNLQSSVPQESSSVNRKLPPVGMDRFFQQNNPMLPALPRRTGSRTLGPKEQVQPPKNLSQEVESLPASQRAEGAFQRYSSDNRNALDSSPTKQPKDQVSERQPLSQDIPYSNNTTLDSDWDSLVYSAPVNEAVSGFKGGKSLSDLSTAINKDVQITKAIKEAEQTGKEMNFFAKEDANSRSVGIEKYDPKQHRIEAGFVVDGNDKILGNHIKVDSTGIQVNVGGELTNLERVIGNPMDWKGRYRPSETMSRNIDANAPNKEIAKQTKEFLVGSKVDAEAKYKTELSKAFNDLGERIKTVQSARPKGVSKADFEDDIFSVLNGDKADSDIYGSYEKVASDAILNYKKEIRNLYDDLLDRINKERVKFGQAPIEARKDYITHLQEMSSDKKFTGEVFSAIKNSFVDEGMQKTRGGLPQQISGRTENFKPMASWNRFLQQRKGEKSLRDPFLAVQAYLEPALYNIHMTEATVRARAVESAFRTAGELQSMNGSQVLDTTKDLLSKYQGSPGSSKMVNGFQEYANALAKKTNSADREYLDKSVVSEKAVKGWQALQRIGGRATIVGNVSSVLAQPLNQVIGMADAGVSNYLKGLTASVAANPAWKQSTFLKARFTKIDAPLKSNFDKTMDAGGVPLQEVEKASIKILWNTQFAKAKSKGLSGMKAIREADFNTERLVAGRGIADRPEIYRSTVYNGFLQYTLEVNAQNKAFWKDLDASQKATFVVAAAGLNTVYSQVTGFEPLPDFLKAAYDTGKDFIDPDDERTTGEKSVSGLQRFAGEAVSMNPLTSATANAVLPQTARRSLFGSDSPLGQFEGTAAPVQVIRNAFNAANSASKGNLTAARNDALKVIPFGNQIRKTVTGAEANIRGFAVDRNGKKTFDTPTSLYGQAQNLIFGPNSSAKAKEYYNKDEKPKTTGDTPKELIKAGFTTPEAKEFFSKTEDEQKSLAANDPKLQELLDHKRVMERAFSETQLPKGMREDTSKFLKNHGRLTDEAREKQLYTQNDYEFKLKVSEYERDKLEGKLTKKEDMDRQRALKKLAFNKDYSKEAREVYTMSADRIEEYLEANGNDKLVDELLKLDLAEVNAGYRKKTKLVAGKASGKSKAKTARKAGSKTAKARKGRKAPAIPKDLVNKAIDIPKLGRVRKASFSVRKPATPNFKKSRPSIPKIAAAKTPTVRRTKRG